MSKSRTHGIEGLLDQILTTGDAQPPEPSAICIPARPFRRGDAGIHPPCRSPGTVRRGRPPGKPSTPRLPKEKVTVRITASLIAAYRDWSWEARSQLSQLVERALSAYHDQNRIQRHSK